MTALLLTVALLALLATVPVEDVVLRDRVEVIETNHFYDADAKPVFTQAIFWSDDNRIIDWRLVRNRQDEPRANIEVRRDYRTGGYVAAWDDNGLLREVRAKCWRETWTQYDVELVDRDKWPVCNRRLLSKPARFKP